MCECQTPQDPRAKILRDDEIVLTERPARPLPGTTASSRARVEVDGVEREMVFLTNNLDWGPRSVADLYRCRWQIEVFFKQIKQTLQLADFLGYNANAVRWQVWSGVAGLRAACVTKPFLGVDGAAASPAFSPSFAPRFGNIWTCAIFWNAVGQQAGAFEPSRPRKALISRLSGDKLWDSRAHISKCSP